MRVFFNLIMSEFQKVRRTPMIWIHSVLSVLIAVMFIFYYRFSYVSSSSKVSGYLEITSIGFPLIIGIVTGMSVDQEAMAGNFQPLLMTRYKLRNFFSKICMLLLLALFSLVLSVGIFAFGMQFIIQDNLFSGIFYGKIILILFFSSVFLYFLHMICSFRFGSGASIGLGIAESLISALMLTGLGDRIWQFIPCSFSVRFSDYYVLVNSYNTDIYMDKFKTGIFSCILMTLAIIAISAFWFYRFEGRSED